MSKSYAIYNMDHSLLWYFVKQNIEENDLWCHNNANEVEAEKDDKLILNTVEFRGARKRNESSDTRLRVSSENYGHAAKFWLGIKETTV